ncbi:hypothetical protein Cgig2_003734 [Carnegiea gigantea]|uniref:Uncharacterized protein n=1 Tax=Carnegiea gigantea TaxID=171969 RepID=A0A9Q1JK56_9CARY|nr:hypothetical protein Cgig2_003734 [Carnegiea gigantea]
MGESIGEWLLIAVAFISLWCEFLCVRINLPSLGTISTTCQQITWEYATLQEQSRKGKLLPGTAEWPRTGLVDRTAAEPSSALVPVPFPFHGVSQKDLQKGQTKGQISPFYESSANDGQSYDPWPHLVLTRFLHIWAPYAPIFRIPGTGCGEIDFIHIFRSYDILPRPLSL